MKCNICAEELNLINIRTKWTFLGDKIRQESLCNNCFDSYQPERSKREELSKMEILKKHNLIGCVSLKKEICPTCGALNTTVMP